MTEVRYKNWKSEIAWLRRMAKNCKDLELSSRGVVPSDTCDAISRISIQLNYRADSLERAKGTAQSS